MIADHYVLVQRWRPNFNPWKADHQKRVAVWVRIPDLPHELYNVESIRRIGNMIGKTLKIDRTTAFSEKGGMVTGWTNVRLQPKVRNLGIAHRRLHLWPRLATEKTPIKEVNAMEKSKGNDQGVNYGPEMLVKRELGNNSREGGGKGNKSEVAINKAEKGPGGINVSKGGDFNATLASDERCSWRSTRGSDREFCSFVDDAGLHDLGFVGPPFTWKRIGWRVGRIEPWVQLLGKRPFLMQW
ncbi:hypothetical protein K1719_005430 [Acacia pycnantha]|nr:hypothetical protein K1719_005430 [Acacia pycnantha]